MDYSLTSKFTLLSFQFLVSTALIQAVLEPVLVQTVFRHGDRSSVSSYPSDPYPESQWPQGYGQLSTTGMSQHYKLGSYFRERYIQGKPYRLLNQNYSRYEIYIRSTDYDRTLMSAYSHLAGLYPPTGNQIWNENITWQPIPVHTEPVDMDYNNTSFDAHLVPEISLQLLFKSKDDDKILVSAFNYRFIVGFQMLYTDNKCPTYTKLYQEILQSDIVKKEEQENKEFYQFVAEKAGLPTESIDTVWTVSDTLLCESLHPELGFKLPDWSSEIFHGVKVLDKLVQLESFKFTLMYNTTQMSRLRGGSLVGQIIDNIQTKLNNTVPGSTMRKYYIFSAHDSTVAAFMSALKTFNHLSPPYAATVIVELMRDTETGHYYVQLFYKNDTSQLLHKLKLPNCEMLCPLEDFIQLLQGVIPEDIHAECGLSDTSASKKDLYIVIGVCVVAEFIFAIVIFSILKWNRNRRSRDHGRYAVLASES